MAPKDDRHLDIEEEFHDVGKKRASRKERKRLKDKDRSKYKKTDIEKTKSAVSQTTKNLREGRVLSIAGERILVDHRSQEFFCVLKGVLKKEKTQKKNLIVVGDFVLFTETGNEFETIVKIEERKSYLSRADNLSRKKEQLIAVNIDQAFITVSLFYPYLKPTLVDRYLIAAKKGNMQPLIVVNKIDYLQHPPDDMEIDAIETEKGLFEDFISTYETLGYSLLLISAKTKEGVDDLKKHMQNKASVFVGQSGVGKTSLINAATSSNLRVGEIVEKTKKGSHTTTTAILLPIEGTGFVIDTPGIKSFGLWDLSPAEIHANFAEIETLSKDCHYPNCTHLHEPGCAVKESVDAKRISLMRYESYQTLMHETQE